MIIAFFVNDMEREFAGYTTTVLAYEAHSRGHGVCYVTPDDFLLTPDDRLHVHGRFLPKPKFKSREDFFTALGDAAGDILLFNGGVECCAHYGSRSFGGQRRRSADQAQH